MREFDTESPSLKGAEYIARGYSTAGYIFENKGKIGTYNLLHTLIMVTPPTEVVYSVLLWDRETPVAVTVSQVNLYPTSYNPDQIIIIYSYFKDGDKIDFYFLSTYDVSTFESNSLEIDYNISALLFQSA